MILRELGVEAWRCFLRPFVVTGLTPGANIVHGPNESGKSTLFTALAHALLTHHRTQGRGVDELRPWGTALSPRTWAEIEVGGERLRVAKRFLEGRACLLERWDAARGEHAPLAEGDGAEERLRALLGARAGARGPARLEQWGVAELLWVPQGGATALPRIGEELQARLRAGVGGIALSAREAALLERLEQHHTTLFQERRGGPRAGTDWPRLRQQAEGLRRELERAAEQRQQLEQLAAKLTLAGEERAAITLRRAALHADRDRLATRATAARQLRERRERAAAEEEASRGAFEVLDVFRERLGALQLTLRELAAVTEALTRRQTTAERELDELLQRYAAQREEAARVEREIAGHEQRAELARLREAQRTLRARQARLAELAAERAAAPAASDGAAPTAAELRDAEEAWARQAAAHDAATFLIRLEAIEPLVVDFAGGRGELLAAGAVAEREVSGPVKLTIANVGRVLIQPQESDGEHRAAVAARWQTVRERFGVTELAELRWRLRAVELAARITEEERALLGPGETAAGIAAALRALDERVQRAVEHGAAAECGAAAEIAAAEYATVDQTALQAALEEAWGQGQRAASAVVDAQRALEELREALQGLGRDRDEAERGRRTAQRELDELTARCGSAEELQAQWRRARQRLDAARDRLAELAAAEPPEGVAAEQQLAHVDEELAQQEDALQRLREVEVRCETRLADAQHAGLHEELALREEELARVEREARRAEARARGARLLTRLGRRIRDELAAGLAAPLARELGVGLERVTGRPARAVELDPTFTVRGIRPAAATFTGQPEGTPMLAVSELSGGTREQLGLLYRLALGRVLAAATGEKLLVVLDDPLGDTDAARQARLVELLAEQSACLQLVILTCHPERYVGIPDAALFPIPC